MTKTEKEGIKEYLYPLLQKYSIYIKSIADDDIVLTHTDFKKLTISTKISRIDWLNDESVLRSLFSNATAGGGKPRTQLETLAMNYVILVIMNYMGGIPQADSNLQDMADWQTIKGYYKGEAPPPPVFPRPIQAFSDQKPNRYG